MAASTTHSSHMPGLRLRYGRGVGRGRSPPGTAATTQTADGHRMRPVSPCGPPRLPMWRFGCPMIRIDAGGTAGAQSAAALAHTGCCSRKSPRSRVFLNSRPFLQPRSWVRISKFYLKSTVGASQRPKSVAARLQDLLWAAAPAAPRHPSLYVGSLGPQEPGELAARGQWPSAITNNQRLASPRIVGSG